MRLTILLTIPLFILFSSFTFNTNHHPAKPVKWIYNSAPVGDGQYKLMVVASLAKGWTLYSMDSQAKDGPIPTSVEFKKDGNVQLIGETKEIAKKQKEFDKTMGMELVKISGRANYVQMAKVKDPSKAVKGELTFMACNGSTCLPPEKINFNIALD